MTTNYKAIGTDDAVNTCDCCGKTNLKATVLMEDLNTGALVHFGSVCATRHSGRSISVIRCEIDARQMAIKNAVAKALRESAEGRAYEAALAAAHAAKVPCGHEFKAAVAVEMLAARTKEASLKSHYEATL